MINKKIKAVVFDAGGVITEWRQTIDAFLDELGVDFASFQKATEPDELLVYKGLMKTEDYYQRTMKRLGREEKWARLTEIIPANFTRIEATFNLLEELQGKVRLAMLTNAYDDSVDELDTKVNHKKYFELIIDSSVVGMMKPDKEIYLLTCQKLQLKPSQCLFVDDDLKNVEAAIKLGFNTVYFTEPEESVKLIRKILYESI
ncbi:MAG: HAD family phosphatase [Candidatus Beckwithbacteria bacterium]|nr:HAD family phosphatase [Candidatus Beckwithbacteria bacterium]